MTIVIDHESLVTATLTYAPSDSGNDAQTLRHDSLNRHHIFSLDDLEPDTEYRYSIETAHSDYNSGERTFRTLPTRPSKYRVIAMGDVRSHPEVWHRVSRQIFENEIQALFMVGTGDYPQDGTRYGQWVEQFFQPGRDLLA